MHRVAGNGDVIALRPLPTNWRIAPGQPGEFRRAPMVIDRP